MIYNLLLAIVVSVSIDSTTLMLGDQTRLHLEVTKANGEQVEWPVFGEELQDGIEIVDRTEVDSVKTKDGRIQVRQDLTLTSFRDSLFVVEPIAVVSGEDTFLTDPLALNVVQPFEVDSSLNITDIKKIERAPIWWWGITRWFLLALALCGLGVGIYFLVRWLQSKRRPQEEVIPQELLRPAEEVALEKLDAIKAAKIWKDGKVKEYQTELTDVVREYIGRRFDVHSTEKTSDETLRELKPILVNGANGDASLNGGKELYEKLRKMLQLADLVKFAKWHTTPDENEKALSSAYEFVNETTEVINDENGDATKVA